jgi:hypothetical protein
MENVQTGDQFLIEFIYIFNSWNDIIKLYLKIKNLKNLY